MIVVINEFFGSDRDQPWICDTDKLDLSDTDQKKYFDMILDAVSQAEITSINHHVPCWYFSGSPQNNQLDTRPESVEKAKILPPCHIDHMIDIYYE